MTVRSRKRLIQVPIDDGLLTRIDSGASTLHESRAEFVRTSCEVRLTRLENEALDRRYRAGYAAVPEDQRWADVSAAWLAATLPKEKW